jgi:DNA-binding transcriptional ArsR family regulator
MAIALLLIDVSWLLSSISIEHDRSSKLDQHQTIPEDQMGTTSRAEPEVYDLPAVLPVGTVGQVLAALADPVRLEMVRRMAIEQAPVACGLLYEGISKSTASHHFKILREAGITERVVLSGQTHQRLRLDELEAALPGVVTAVVAATR